MLRLRIRVDSYWFMWALFAVTLEGIRLCKDKIYYLDIPPSSMLSELTRLLPKYLTTVFFCVHLTGSKEPAEYLKRNGLCSRTSASWLDARTLISGKQRYEIPKIWPHEALQGQDSDCSPFLKLDRASIPYSPACGLLYIWVACIARRSHSYQNMTQFLWTEKFIDFCSERDRCVRPEPTKTKWCEIWQRRCPPPHRKINSSLFYLHTSS